MKVSILTLGCKVNQFESQSMIHDLEAHGYTLAQEGEYADITVINSCAVTAVSEQKAIKMIHRIRRENPDTVLILTGCMPQAFPNIADTLPEVDVVLGNKRRADLIPTIESYLSDHKKLSFIESYGKSDPYEALEISKFHERTRAFLKIEDGCNRFCSYCIIPYARGRVRSCTYDYIAQKMREFSAEGYKEVVVVGINLSSFGTDNGLEFAKAIETACTASEIRRIRLGSLEPESMDLETLKRFSALEGFCPQFHLSLQSGCDDTLRRMNRHYTTAEYAEIVSNIRKVFDNPSITTDVMVGFAGETEEEFKQSMQFVRDMAFAKVHIFPYSRRQGTAADRRTDHISQEIKKERAARMATVANETRRAFLRSQIGRQERVLLETRRDKEGRIEGYTPNYTPVWVQPTGHGENDIVTVTITEAFEDYCIGE